MSSGSLILSWAIFPLVLLHAFRHMDHDGDGSLTYPELRCALGPAVLDLDIAEPDLSAMIDAIDADRNGLISFKV
jgi:Ca2+-binding EF-hand superfamily protein